MEDEAMDAWPARLLTAGCLVLALLRFTPMAPLRPASAVAAAANPIQVENSQPGTTSWQIDSDANGAPLVAANHDIEGYASLTSVNVGDAISFMVSLSSAAPYTMDIYRMGYYAGAGGRLLQHVGPLAGSPQATCPRTMTTTNFGLTECAWPAAYTLRVPSDGSWVSGGYLVKLRRTDSGLESYIPFTVRNDGAPADLVFSMEVTTWQAYNFWGGAGNDTIGYSLYGQFHDSGAAHWANIPNGPAAAAVSFDRPYTVAGETDGAGLFFIWDYSMLRWLEQQGYNVTYVTDVDLENNATLLAGRKGFINAGHDEYYSAAMRAHVEDFINAGANAAFFSANNVYFQIRWASDAAGQPERTEICYKNPDLDPVTVRWRDLAPPQPENALVGVMQNGLANARPWEVADASSWIFAGTGLVNYTGGTPVTSGPGQNAIAKIVGYEFDERAANATGLAGYAGVDPPGLQQVAHSAVPASDNGVAAYSDATLYTAPSGALVFAAGTIQWAWVLDPGYDDGANSGHPGYTDPKGQQITANILNRFINTTRPPAPAVSLTPGRLDFAAQPVGTTSEGESVTLTNAGNAALTISRVSLAGTNPGDFAQTTTCPLTPDPLPAGASCSVFVTFSPDASGSRTASLALSDSAGGTPQTLVLAGTGTMTAPPAINLTPGHLSFAAQQINTSSPSQTLTLTNTGTAALALSSIGFTGIAAGDFAQTTSCPLQPSTLVAGASCAITVSFTPTTSGSRPANLTVTDNAADNPQTVPLSGIGTLPPDLFLDDGFEGASVGAWTVITGGGSATVQTRTVEGGRDAADLTNAAGQRVGLVADLAGGAQTLSYSRSCFNLHDLGTTVLAQGSDGNDTVRWEVDYDATRQSLDGSFWNGAGMRFDLHGRNGLLAADAWHCAEVAANETTNGQGQLWLDGTSIGTVNGDLGTSTPYSRLFLWNQAPGTVDLDDVRVSNRYNGPVVVAVNVVSPPSISFANQPVGTTSTGQAVTLRNTGSVAETIASIGFTGANAGDFARTTSCPLGPATLAGRASCTITVTFAPPEIGSRSASLVITTSTPTATTVDVPITATAIQPPAVRLTTGSLDFGTLQTGTPSAPQAVTVTNTGSGPLVMTSIGVSGSNPGDFRQTNSCPLSPHTLEPNESCRVTVAFLPTAAGNRAANLTFADNAADSPQIVALAGIGVLPPSPYLVDDFEGHDLRAWDTFDGGGTASLQAGTVNSGHAAVALTNTASEQFVGLAADLAGGAEAQTDTRFCFNLHAIQTSIVLAQGRDDSGHPRWEVDYNAGRQSLDLYFWNGAGSRDSLFPSANLVRADTWYCAEVADNETISGEGQVWLNGTSIGKLNVDLAASTPYSRLVLFNDAAVGTVYFDDVVVSGSFYAPVGAGAALPLPAP